MIPGAPRELHPPVGPRTIRRDPEVDAMTSNVSPAGAGASPALRILSSWSELERALRDALPACSLVPPTQPAELLAALRVIDAIGAEDEAEVTALREIRNRVAHLPEEPSVEEAEAYEARVEDVRRRLPHPREETC